jgi:Domain of unknown function (DUF4276)
MKHLYIIVEGQTELEFVNKILTPYFSSQNIITHIQGIPIYISGGGHGFNNIEHFKNTIKPVMSYKNEPIITTLIDYFKLNSETKLPGFKECPQDIPTDNKIQFLENKLNDIVQNITPYKFFIPYIQKHEMETLMFANPEVGFSLENDRIKKSVLEVYNKYKNIEEINGTENGAPSNRLKAIYKANDKKYEKIVDGMDIAELTGIEKMLEKSPRFKNWIEKLIKAIQK